VSARRIAEIAAKKSELLDDRSRAVAELLSKELDRMAVANSQKKGGRETGGDEAFSADIKRIEGSELFDEEWYLEINPDVLKAGVLPAEHYLKFGWHEGRDPSPEFDTLGYQKKHPKAARLEICPLVHYLKHR